MPRKRRLPKVRHGLYVGPGLFEYLVFRCPLAEAMRLEADSREDGEAEIARSVFYQPGGHERYWAAIVEDAIAEWAQYYPGSRPERWWEYSAPELRRISGGFTVLQGASRCQSTGIPYGSPADEKHPPMVESEPAFLDRHGLWLPGERRRVPPSEFLPSPFDWALTVGQTGRPGDD